MQLLELLTSAVLEIKRPPTGAFARAAAELCALATCLTDSDLETYLDISRHSSSGGVGTSKADNSAPQRGIGNGVAASANGGASKSGVANAETLASSEVQQAVRRLHAMGAHLRSLFQSGYRPAPTFAAIDEVGLSLQLTQAYASHIANACMKAASRQVL